MGGFKATYINELEKLYKKKKVIVAVILSIVVIILGQLGITGLKNGLGISSGNNSSFPLLILSVVANSILPLFTTLVTIDSFSGELSSNTVKIILTRPVSRFKYLSAKVCAITIFIITNLLFILVLSIITGILFNKNSYSILSFYRVIISYIVTLFPLILLSLIIILFTNFVRSGVGVFFLTIVTFIVFKVLEVLFSGFSSLFFTYLLNWYNLWIMDSFPLFKILRIFLLMASYAIILFTVNYYLIDKKDY